VSKSAKVVLGFLLCWVTGSPGTSGASFAVGPWSIVGLQSSALRGRVQPQRDLARSFLDDVGQVVFRDDALRVREALPGALARAAPAASCNWRWRGYGAIDH